MYFERSEDESKYPFSFNNSCNNIRDLLPWQKYLLKPHQDMFSVLVKIQKITRQGKPKLPIKFNPLKENKSLCIYNHIDLCIGETNYSSIWKKSSENINFLLHEKCPYSELIWSASFPHCPAFKMREKCGPE